jgi:CNT family concentrative nucleoside transporter
MSESESKPSGATEPSPAPGPTGSPGSPDPSPATAFGGRLPFAAVAAGAVVLVILAAGTIPTRVQAVIGLGAFLALAAALSADVRRIDWRCVFSGLALQFALGFFVLRLQFGDWRPGFALFTWIGDGFGRLTGFASEGAKFVFGPLADGGAMGKAFGPEGGFVFVTMAMPAVIFVSAFFTLLYYFGVLQLVVKGMAFVMIRLMRVSGAEALSNAANVFMGQTEAPLIIKPYIPKMTKSELLVIMAGGMATIAGSVMAAYVAMGADRVALLATSVMAAPSALYLAKMMLPETERSELAGGVKANEENPHANAIDAVSAGASEGVSLVLNICAMLIAFLALIALINAVLAAVPVPEGWPTLSLSLFFSKLFYPAALLIGVGPADAGKVADLLGIKLVANEFVAFLKLTGEYKSQIDPASFTLATYALTGFANLSSVGIQIGGIGAMAPARRSDLARLGFRALAAGFLATLVNSCVAAILL